MPPTIHAVHHRQNFARSRRRVSDHVLVVHLHHFAPRQQHSHLGTSTQGFTAPHSAFMTCQPGPGKIPPAATTQFLGRPWTGPFGNSHVHPSLGADIMRIVFEGGMLQPCWVPHDLPVSATLLVVLDGPFSPLRLPRVKSRRRGSLVRFASLSRRHCPTGRYRTPN